MATPIDFSIAKEQYEYLRKRGIQPHHIEQLGLEITTSLERVKELGLPAIPGLQKAIIFPVFNIHGEQTGLHGGRYFYQEGSGATFLGETSGNKPKFLSPKGAKMHYYFPQNIDWSKLESYQRVFICESYVKAAVMCHLGYHAVGISGCHGWGREGKLHPGILDIGWQELNLRPVIFWDSNVHEGRPQLYTSARRLATRLGFEAGVDAAFIQLPAQDGDDWGLDDFYMTNGEAALRELAEGDFTVMPSDIQMHIEALDSEVVYVESIAKVAREETGTLMSRDIFINMAYANRLVWDDDREVSIPRRWMAWGDRREVRELKYKPGAERVVQPDYFNLWNGMGTSPVPGDVSLWSAWLNDAFPSEAERVWFEQWLAWPLQNLGGKLTTFVFLTGPSGVGKGWLAQLMKAIYGHDNCSNIMLQSLEDKFNAHYAAKQLVVIEECESIPGQGSRMYTRLKDIVTNPVIEYHPKGVTPTTIDNHINLLLEGNDISALGRIDKFDRRLAAIEVRDHDGALANNKEYWKPRWEWLYGDGPAALYSHLLDVSMEGFDPAGEAPMTEAKQDIISMGMTDQEEWISELLNNPHFLDNHEGSLFNAKELYWIMFNEDIDIGELNSEDYAGKVKSFSLALGRARVPKYDNGKKIKCPYTKKSTPYYQVKRLPVGGTLSNAQLIRQEWRDTLYFSKGHKM